MSGDKRQDYMGVFVALFGMAMCVAMYARGDLTTTLLVVWLGVVAFGAYLVSPMATRNAISDGATFAERFGFSRAGRRETDPVAVPVPLVPEIEMPAPIDVAAAERSPYAQRPIQPEIAQRPPEARPAPNVEVEPSAPKPKRKRKPHTPATDAPAGDGEEFGAEQVDAADIPEKHEPADYRPLGLVAMPEGVGDKRVGRFFVLGEFAVSGSHPELAAPVPARLAPQVVRLASSILDPIRVYVGHPVTVLSGYRSPRLNAAVGGSPTSQHLYAAAADITCHGVQIVFESLLGGSLTVPCGQCIYYPSKAFFHIALPGWRYRSPTFQIHEPSKGLRYRQIQSVKELHELGGGL